MLVPLSTSSAQLPAPRTQFVYHVNVDPLFGDDTLATSYNPGAPNRLPLSTHPDTTSSNPQPISGLIHHAPYSFRTIAGALNYIRGVFPTLPWFNPSTNTTVEHVVVHCLPGLYGPRIVGLPDVDPVSGLPWNGEPFPIDLRAPPDRISLQGTSALDTILDARNAEQTGLFFSYIIHVEGQAQTGNFSHDGAFIDGFTIRGARANNSPTRNPTGAGVYIRGNQPQPRVRITISNCIITNNDIGIAVDSAYDPVPWPPIPPQFHEPRVINNTIAWNRIGLWASDLNPPRQPADRRDGSAVPDHPVRAHRSWCGRTG
jgi:hypothetical protein